MLQESDLPGLVGQVLLASFVLAAVFGAIAQRTQFCTMGAVADVVNMGDWGRVRMWLLAIGTAMLGFNGMVAAGWIAAADTVYAAPRVIWLSNLVGGALFGFGMVLASGCGSKTLVRIGGGSLKGIVVFAVLAIASYATLRGITAVARVNTVDAVAFTLPVGQDLPSLLAHASGLPPATAALLLGLLIGGALLAWALSSPEGRSGETLLAGIGIGLVIVGVWWVTGHLGHLEEHPATLEEAWLATNTQRMPSRSPSSHPSPTRWTGSFSSATAASGSRWASSRCSVLSSARRSWRWPRGVSVGKGSPVPRTPPTTWSARC
jgi:uncharacterized protein